MTSSLSQKLIGHYHTFIGRPRIRKEIHALHSRLSVETSRPPFEATRSISLDVHSPFGDILRVSALYTPSRLSESAPILIILPGLGGDESADYLELSALYAYREGWASLRLSQRGTGPSDPGLYHGGLYQDVLSWLDHPELLSHQERYGLGFSMGGHQLARFACASETQGKMSAIATCSAPMNLSLTQEIIDHKTFYLYKRYLLSGIQEMSARLVRAPRDHRSRQNLSDEVVERVGRACKAHSIKAWDQDAICPYFGYSSPQSYYQQESASTHLEKIHTPLLLTPTRFDPLIRLSCALPHREDPLLTLKIVDQGGHIYTSPQVELGFEGELGLIPQIFKWFTTQ